MVTDTELGLTASNAGTNGNSIKLKNGSGGTISTDTLTLLGQYWWTDNKYIICIKNNI